MLRRHPGIDHRQRRKQTGGQLGTSTMPEYPGGRSSSPVPSMRSAARPAGRPAHPPRWWRQSPCAPLPRLLPARPASATATPATSPATWMAPAACRARTIKAAYLIWFYHRAAQARRLPGVLPTRLRLAAAEALADHDHAVAATIQPSHLLYLYRSSRRDPPVAGACIQQLAGPADGQRRADARPKWRGAMTGSGRGAAATGVHAHSSMI